MNKHQLWDKIKKDFPDFAEVILEVRRVFGKPRNVRVIRWPDER